MTLTEVFEAAPAEIAGMSTLMGAIGTDLRNASAYVNTHASPSDKPMGQIISEIVPACGELVDFTVQRFAEFASITTVSGTNLNRAAWMYHEQDQKNYEALNRATLEYPTTAPTGANAPEQGVTAAYANPVVYTAPTMISLGPPDTIEEDLVRKIEEKSGWLGDFNQGIRQATNNEWSPLNQLFEPLSGNWNELKRIGATYRIAGAALEDSSKNLSWGVNKLSAHWDGKAAISFEDHSRNLSAALEWWGPVGRTVDFVMTTLVQQVTDACLAIANKLKEMLEAEVDISDGKSVVKVALKKVPVVGTAYQVASLANIVLSVWNTIKPLLEKIKNLVTSAKNLLSSITGSKSGEPGKFARLNETLSPLTQTAVNAQQAGIVSSDVARIAAGAETQQTAPQQGYDVGANPWENG
ncbi:hypothetical protein ACRS5S_33905 [Nocardia asiatica]|uniref:hypothetical protein n=1 Tax=Nocardia asiatica TaxID=209252 RepID=UPI003EDE8FF2